MLYAFVVFELLVSNELNWIYRFSDVSVIIISTLLTVFASCFFFFAFSVLTPWF